MKLSSNIARPLGPLDAATFRRGWISLWREDASIYPLVTFRVVFGLVAAFGAWRFMHEGWIESLLVEPTFFFDFYGFDWIIRPNRIGAYALYSVILLSAICIALGYRYRLATVLFWCSFTYAELVDATNYLNHYYLVILLGGLLVFMPAHRLWSIDVEQGRVKAGLTAPRWCRIALITQLSLVYFFAGLAKVNSDWLLQAKPLAIWLPERADFPLFGPLFAKEQTAYAFSWLGMLYDLTIWILLLYRPTRGLAYAAVIVFHLVTGWLFNIGLFPLIMISSTLIFFGEQWHERLWKFVGSLVTNARLDSLRIADFFALDAGRSLQTEPELGFDDHLLRLASAQSHTSRQEPGVSIFSGRSDQHETRSSFLRLGLVVFFIVQVVLPLRAYAWYDGPVAWGEEGYRFGWRVMLVEKVGDISFQVHDSVTERVYTPEVLDYLTPYQAKQMAIQPDFILQFAHHLASQTRSKYNFVAPQVYATSYVSLNGRRSREFIDPSVNLAALSDGLTPKPWIKPFACD